MRLSLPRILLILLVAAYAVGFAYLTLVRYAAFEARALDMGNLDQAIWNTAHGRWFHFTNQPGVINRLSLHVEPILIPISWLYWIYSGPPTLLILQATVVALAALPCYALARHQLHSEWMGLVFAVVLLLNPSLQAANWLEFHPLTLAPTFLLAAFYYLQSGQTRLYALFAILAASCKEEMALLVFMIGLYAAVMMGRRRLGLWTMTLALTWALTAVFGIQRIFADGNIHWGRYAYLGETPVQMVVSLLTRPDLVLEQLRAANALGYLARLLLPVGGLALLAPELLLLALPSLAINLLADFPPMHEVHSLIYAAPVVPFVLIAAIHGTARLRQWLGGTAGTQADRGRWLLAAAATWLLVCALVDQRLHGYLPGGGNYRHFTITDHHRRAAAIIEQIEADAKVSAQDRLVPHASGRETVYIFPRLDLADGGDGTGRELDPATQADTVWIDVTGPAWPQHPNDLRASVEGLLENGYGVAAADDGYLLLRRGLAARALPDSFYTAWQRPAHQPLHPYQIDFGDEMRLVDAAVETDSQGEVVVRLYWQALRPLERDLQFYVAYLDREGNHLHSSEFYPPVAALWYPTSVWQPGMTVLVQTLPWSLEQDQFVLAVGLSEERWSKGERLPIANMPVANISVNGSSSSQPSLPLLENKTLVRLGGYQRDAAGVWTPIPTQFGPPAVPMDIRFGEQIALDGVAQAEIEARAGDPVEFTLYWRALEPVDRDYTVFAHLLDAQGGKVAQLDWQPGDAVGRLPMTTWLVDQTVVDRQTLELPMELSAGFYRFIVGLYYWEDGQRLPVHGANAETDDVVTVATIEVQ